jgi:hypothetical protein
MNGMHWIAYQEFWTWLMLHWPAVQHGCQMQIVEIGHSYLHWARSCR